MIRPELDTPEGRLALAIALPPDVYNSVMDAHRKASVMATHGGHDIRPVQTRFGRLFAVGNTGRAFSTLPEAETFARANPA